MPIMPSEQTYINFEEWIELVMKDWPYGGPLLAYSHARPQPPIKVNPLGCLKTISLICVSIPPIFNL
ncbi:hypothetical protein RclHR1_06840006 [Rhizophagus clarus]|uniref:Uncharacterized protein n=1 Tax=Rhizophagus clarus TaxID=94130 RepID=A0A2Z6SB81_9GLOM|nr:hypothetical protein RclHR1_06840006 [Rhizophagus clarus]